jgi:hypothetical protein
VATSRAPVEIDILDKYRETILGPLVAYDGNRWVLFGDLIDGSANKMVRN